MADTKIAALTARTTIAGTDEFPSIAGGANFRSPVSSIAAYLATAGVIQPLFVNLFSSDTLWTSPLFFATHHDAPTSGVTIAADSITIAATTGRLYKPTPLTTLGFPSGNPIGKKLRVRFKILSGALATKTWQVAGGTPQSGSFTANGDWYEVVITAVQASATNFIYDLQNTAGSSAVISRIEYAFEAERTLGYNLSNRFSPTFVVAVAAGGGTATNEDGVLTLSADVLATALVLNLSIDQGATVSWLMKITPSLVRRVYVEYRNGANTDVLDLNALGNGYFGGIHTVAGSVGVITDVKLHVENRALAFYTNVAVEVSEITLVEGAQFPLMPALTPQNLYYDPTEIVCTQTSTTIHVYVHDGTLGLAGYVEYRLLRTDDAVAQNAECWTFDGAWKAARTGDTAFTRGDQLMSGENTVAILEDTKTDHMGGPTHGNHRDNGPDDFARLLIDGIEQTIDGSTTFRCTRAELMTRAGLIEAPTLDAPPWNTNRLAELITSHAIDGKTGKLRLSHHLIWNEIVVLDQAYLGMGAFTNEFDFAARHPLWAEEDVTSIPSPIMDTSRHVKLWGTGVSAEMTIVEGWAHASRIFHISQNSGPKVYFSAYNSYTTSVNEVWDFAVEYRLGSRT